MSEVHENIKRKVEAKLTKSGLPEDAKDEIRGGVDQTISESVEAEKAGTKIDWPSILSEIFTIIESYIASANTAKK